jgi:hypothetical protein
MSFGGPEPKAAPPLPDVPQSPAPPPAFGLQNPARGPQGSKPKKQSMMPSFLGADSTPQQAFSGKTLLGQ